MKQPWASRHLIKHDVLGPLTPRQDLVVTNGCGEVFPQFGVSTFRIKIQRARDVDKSKGRKVEVVKPQMTHVLWAKIVVCERLVVYTWVVGVPAQALRCAFQKFSNHWISVGKSSRGTVKPLFCPSPKRSILPPPLGLFWVNHPEEGKHFVGPIRNRGPRHQQSPVAVLGDLLHGPRPRRIPALDVVSLVDDYRVPMALELVLKYLDGGVDRVARL